MTFDRNRDPAPDGGEPTPEDPKREEADPAHDKGTPKRLCADEGLRPGESIPDWFRRVFGEMPAPTADMDADEHAQFRERRHEALRSLARSIPPVYRWASFIAPELAERVATPGAIADARRICLSPRVCLMGASRTGKTSLAVAMLRRWVSEHGRHAEFIAVHRLGFARIQHAAGHGEPEIVDLAMKAPLTLLDDVGSERDTGTNPLPDIVFERHAAQRPTWVTTGLTREQLLKRYGTGVVSRLFDQTKVLRLGSGEASEL
jgi:DNA replication protein DnaC